MATLKVNTLSGIGTEGPVLNGGLHFRSKNYLTLPKGNTTQRISTSSGISTVIGAIRYNTDSNKMECYVNNKWMIVSTSSPNLDGGARAVFGAGMLSPSNAHDDRMDYVTISTAGNAISFGDASANYEHKIGATASNTRGLFGGGNAPGQVNTIDFITISSTGNASDFGDLTTVGNTMASCGNQTRGLFCNGHRSNSGSPYNSDVIDYVAIASAGNSVDFGDTVNDARQRWGSTTPTRGFVANGVTSSGNANTIEMITIATLGSAVDSGFDTVSSFTTSCQTATNGKRIVFQLDTSSPFPIGYFNAFNLSNSMSFGDLNANGSGSGGYPCSSTRGLFGAQGTGIDYINISTEGIAVDFGDLTVSRYIYGWVSNAHGGW